MKDKGTFGTLILICFILGMIYGELLNTKNKILTVIERVEQWDEKIGECSVEVFDEYKDDMKSTFDKWRSKKE